MPVHPYDPEAVADVLTGVGFSCKSGHVPRCTWNGVSLHMFKDTVTVQAKGELAIGGQARRTMSCIAKHVREVEVHRTGLMTAVAFTTDDGDRCSVFGRP